jgi:hypothetical protein
MDMYDVYESAPHQAYEQLTVRVLRDVVLKKGDEAWINGTCAMSQCECVQLHGRARHSMHPGLIVCMLGTSFINGTSAMPGCKRNVRISCIKACTQISVDSHPHMTYIELIRVT